MNKQIPFKKIYHAAIYVRLSKEDGDVSDAYKAESNSISNQKILIRNYLKDKKDIKIVSERVDDGYSGSNFDRPAFQQMLQDIKNGIVDCVVVKDLSRFGREYIDSGTYIQRIFPSLGVRFIAVNDGYDSLDGNCQVDDLLLPFKNLINDAYCRDISIKIRSHLEVKRKKGEFIGAFAPYGYRKDETNRNHLVIDPVAASVVEQIFTMKIQGMSQDMIAKKLNDNGIASPLAYKHQLGSNFKTGFKQSSDCRWSSAAVRRILENEVYIGNLVQGRRTTPNHKIKKIVQRPESEWVRIEKNHEAIISDYDYAIVQELLEMDTRISPGKTSVYPLSGIVVCGECGAPMVRRSSRSDKKVYHYYVCSRNKATKECSSHMLSASKLEDSVLLILKAQIENVLDLKQVIDQFSLAQIQEYDIREINKHIKQKEIEVANYKEFELMLYEDLKGGILSKEDYLDYREAYKRKRSIAEDSILKLKQELMDTLEAKTGKYQWMEHFIKYQTIDRLTRNVAIELIEQVRILDKSEIEVDFNFKDCYFHALEALKKSGCEITYDEHGKIAIQGKVAM